MESTEMEELESAVITVEQMIDICLSPFHIDVNILHALLNIIASKLNLRTVRVQLGAPALLTEINNLIPKSRETYEAFGVVDGGAKRPFKLTLCKLEKIDIEPDPPVKTLYKIKKTSSDIKDFRKVTFFKDSPIVHDLVAGSEVPERVGYTYAELLNLTKRLEACEIGIEKLTQLLQKINSNYKELERSHIEMSTINSFNKATENGSKRASATVDRCSQVYTTHLVKAGEKHLRFDREREARKDIQILQDTMDGVVGQMNNIFGQMSDFRNIIQSLQNENEALKKLLAKSANHEKFEQCLREVCNMQKIVAEFSDKMSDLIICNNKTDQRFKDVNEQLGKVSKFRGNFEKIARLEDFTNNLQSEFENFTERYEQIKVIKADREELDYLFHSKADKEELNNLVNQDVFNAIRTDLSNGIVQAYERIMELEVRWKCSEENISARLKEKLDKSEKTYLTKLGNDKLNYLQMKINELFGLKFDVKSSETRSCALKDVNGICCAIEANIICDKPVLPRVASIRHTRRICPPPPELRKRYCGGSHTVLSPEQRIARRRINPMYINPNREPPNLVDGKIGIMYRVSKPECNCVDKKFQKVLYPTSNTQITNKNQEAVENQSDQTNHSDVKP